MMPALQYLRHGKALCGKVFKRFVETFNYHNDFIANLKGDGDLPMSDGCIFLDLTDPKHPVIRFNKQKLDLPEGEPKSGLPGCFEIRAPKTNGDSDAGGFDNPYYMVGGKFYECEEAKDYGVENMKDVFVYVKVDVTADVVEPTIETAETFSELQTAARNENVYITPLYKFGKHEGEVEIDFRKMPMAISGEFGQ